MILGGLVAFSGGVILMSALYCNSPPRVDGAYLFRRDNDLDVLKLSKEDKNTVMVEQTSTVDSSIVFYFPLESHLKNIPDSVQREQERFRIFQSARLYGEYD